MKRFLVLLVALLLLLSCGCTGTNGDTEPLTSGTDAVSDEPIPEETDTPDTDAPETEPPKEEIILSPEMQQKLGKYIPKNWQSGIDEINEAIPDDFMFAIQTDTHYSTLNGGTTANNIKALSHFIPLSFYANLGDYIKGYYQGEAGKTDNTPELTMQSLKELTSRYLDDANCPVLVTFGNHDTNQLWCQHYGEANQQLTQADHYREVTSKLKEHNGENMVGDGESNYYYMDFPADNVRVIMLNTTDGNYETKFDSVQTISDKQLEWFKNTALKTDKNVIVMAHIPLCNNFPNSGKTAPKNAANILEAVDNFVKNGGNFVAYMYGHTHAQSDMLDEYGKLHISFKSGGSNAEVVAINFKARKIYTFGLGNAEGRDFKY
ncbi:MAG: metallophosphoesterase [Clostridia bacterium]|nr:metallophosphoesterase [Clostridia bacterium]